MEDFKSPKADLIAIYRLEFYKKQKSWKLSTNAKNKRRDVSGKIKYPLNKTYVVVQPQTNACELNEAFIDTGSERPVMNALNCGDNATNAFYTAEETIPKMECSWLPDGEELQRIQENAYYYTEDEWDAKSELSTDSWSDFMRAADLAPHSSEVELSLPSVLSDVELDENSLTRLSSAQLRVAVQSHARVLRRLLREESKRKRIRSFLSLTDRTTDRPVITPRAATDFSSYDEYPTRDINLSSHYYTACNALHRGRTFTKTTEDTFVAGSHNNADLKVLGRGRGKIQAASGNDSRKRIIAIERGRPVRL